MNRRELSVTHTWNEIETVLLDMDGTLLDLHFDQEVWNRLLPERFAIAEDCDVESAKKIVSSRLEGARGSLDWYSLDHWTARLGIDLAALELELSHLIRPRVGAIEFLEVLATSTLRVVLATNAQPSSLQRKLDITGIDRYFDIIGCSHHYGACKEESAFWSGFTKQLGIDPSKTMLIDDNLTVLGTAQAFGIARLYGVRNPSSSGAPVTSHEFHCIKSFDELLAHGNPE